MPLEQILKKVGPKISKMGEIVNGWPAGIDFHFASGRIERMELFGSPRIGVEELQGHQFVVSTVAIAIATMPSPRPIAPNPSLVVALMLICEMSRLSARAIACFIAFRCGAIFGASAIKVASTF